MESTVDGKEYFYITLGQQMVPANVGSPKPWYGNFFYFFLLQVMGQSAGF